MNPMDLLPDKWPLISTLGALIVGAFWAGHKIGAQGKTTLQETHAAHIALLRDRLDFSKQEEEAALRLVGELKAEIPRNAPKLLATKVREVDAAVTDWATANNAVSDSLSRIPTTIGTITTYPPSVTLRSASDGNPDRKS